MEINAALDQARTIMILTAIILAPMDKTITRIIITDLLIMSDGKSPDGSSVSASGLGSSDAAALEGEEL